ncbi:MAG: phage tail sheath subtilisin-like domain-containing protein [Pseudomonadota bacterium]
MAIAFDNIPADLRVPLFYAELGSGGTPFDSAERLLLIGQKLAAGTATANEPVLVTNATLAEETLFGTGSMLADMVKTARQNAPFQEIWALPLDDAGVATAATGTVDFTAATFPLTTTTVFTVYVAGEEYNVTATTASTATTVGDSLIAEINADTRAPVTAANAAGVVTLTAKQAGTLGNSVDVRTNLLGDESPASAQVTITAMAGGAGDPDITAGLANVGDSDFLWFAMPYADATNIAAMSALLSDVSGRWSPLQQLYGHAVTVSYNTVANLSTLGNSLNDQHLTIVGVNDMPSAPWNLAAALGAKVALHLSDPPELSRPLQFIELQGIVAPRISSRFNVTDRNTLLFDGIATIRYTRTGAVQIERLITTYSTNAAGATDATFLDIQTLAQAQYILRYLRNKVLTRHGRQGLADDDSAPINGVARPIDIRNTLIAGYGELAALAVVEGQDAFERNLVVERNAIDYTRVDVSLPFDVINQLRVLAVSAVAYLQLQ